MHPDDKKTFIEKCHNHLFDDKEQALTSLSENQVEKLNRYKDAFVVWLDDPTKTDKQIVMYLEDKYGLSTSQAYRDVSDIKALLGNVRVASKEFQRYTAVEMIKEGYKLAKTAKTALEVKKAESMIRAGKNLGDVNRLNKMDIDELPFEEIVPPDFEPVYDPTLLDGELDEDFEVRKRKLQNKYMYDGKIEDAEIIDDGE